MTEKEAIKALEYAKRILGLPEQGEKWSANRETIAIDMAISSIKELEQYRAIGTAEECREAMELQTPNEQWIACEDRLPEEGKNCLVTVRYTGFMGMHGIWVKTGHIEPSSEWWGDCMGGEVIAWQPLPEPYCHRPKDIEV